MDASASVAMLGIDFSDWMKGAAALGLTALMPMSAWAMYSYARQKKSQQFARFLDDHNLAGSTAAQGLDTPGRAPAEGGRLSDAIPIVFATALALFGAIALLFGQELNLAGDANLVLGGVMIGKPAEQLAAYQRLTLLAVTYAFVGAYLWSLQIVLRRLLALDMNPGVYYGISLRIVFAIMVAVVVRHSFSGVLPDLAQGADSPSPDDILPMLSFLVGMTPSEALRVVATRLPLVRNLLDAREPDLPLTAIEGLSGASRYRLEELQVDDAQNLAAANPLDLVRRAPFQPFAVLDWIAQAQLFCLFGAVNFGKLKSAGVRTSLQFRCCGTPEGGLEALAGETAIPAGTVQRAWLCLGNDAAFQRLADFHDHLKPKGG